LQEIERLAHVLGRPLLAGMGYRMQAEPTGAGEDTLEQARRPSLLRRIEADADEAVAPRQRLIERALGIGLVEMAQEAEDQRRGDAILPLGVGLRTRQAVDHGLEGDAAAGVPLRIEEDLG